MTTTIAIRSALSMVLFVIGIYLFVCAVRVKGMIYMNEALQKTKYYDRYVRLVRIFAFIISGVFLVNLVLNLISYVFQYRYINAFLTNDIDTVNAVMMRAEKMYSVATLSLVLSIAVVVIMLFVSAYITGVYSGKVKTETTAESSAAFNFEEKTEKIERE